MRSVVGALCLLLFATWGATQPRELWKRTVAPTPDHAPLVGEFSATAGYEIVYTTSNPAEVVCLSARGEEEWRVVLEGNQTVTGLAAATTTLPLQDTLIAVAGDRDVFCIYAESGEVFWREEVGPLSAGGLMWLDLEGGNQESLVVATRDNGVIAFNADGTEFWRYSERDHGRALNFSAALAGGDLTNNFTNEVVLALDKGIVVLDRDGKLLWEDADGREISSSPVLADTDGNSVLEVYVLTQNPPGLLALDGDIGIKRWFHPLPPEDILLENEKTDLIAADLHQNGNWTIVASGADGAVVAVSRNGERLWRQSLSEKGPVYLAAGDFSGDLRVDLLAADAAGNLHHIAPWGNVTWTHQYAGNSLAAPVILDSSRSTTTSLLVMDKLGGLQCIQLENSFIPALASWPMARQNTARTGHARNPGTRKTDELVSLLHNGDFEHAVKKTTEETLLPRAWNFHGGASGRWGMSGEQAQSGDMGLWVEPSEESARIRSSTIALPVGLQSVNGSVQYNGGEGARVYLEWLGIDGVVLREDEFSPATGGQWTRFTLGSTMPPENVYTAALTLENTPSETGRVWWDNAQLEARISQVPVVEILYN